MSKTFCLNVIFLTSTKSSPAMSFHLTLASQEPCLTEGPQAHQRIISVQLLVTPSPVWRELCAELEKGLPFWPQINQGKASLRLQRVGSHPLRFTAPTETKLGTATVSAPGPLSSGQDELFAEDIQMYKEQIRLTQSSFARRERERKKERAAG